MSTPDSGTPDQPTPAAPGRFVWHDLVSTDPEASKAFYSNLFGWAYDTLPIPAGPDGQTMPHSRLRAEHEPDRRHL